jgi:4'-phosphopantetheinyl transferase
VKTCLLRQANSLIQFNELAQARQEATALISDFCPLEISDRIHVWTVSLRNAGAAAERLKHVLDEFETGRARQFSFDYLRDSFVALRGALRCLLRHYLATDLSGVRIGYGPEGKPVLLSAGDIEFNVSRSEDLAAIAITARCQVGIDIEHVHELPELEQLARRFFCPEEYEEIISVPPIERSAAFFRCWTRKEAYVKAIGAGLSIPLDGFAVSASESPAHIVHSGHKAGASESWRVRDLDLAPSYSAALAYSGDERPLSQFPIVDIAEFQSLL